MKKRIACFLIVITTFFSCETGLVEKPDDLIPEDRMVEVLYDIAVLNAARSSGAKILQEHDIQPEEFIYKKFNIDSLQFAKSSVYYASKPNVHIRIFEEVEHKLKEQKKIRDSLLRKGYEELHEKPKGVINKDSLIKLRKRELDSIR